MSAADCGPPAGRKRRVNTSRSRGSLSITKFVPGLLPSPSSSSSFSLSRLYWRMSQLNLLHTSYVRSERWCYLMYASELSVNLLLRYWPSHDPAAVWHHEQRWKTTTEVPHSSESVNTREGGVPRLKFTLKKCRNWYSIGRNITFYLLFPPPSILAPTLPTMQRGI